MRQEREGGVVMKPRAISSTAAVGRRAHPGSVTLLCLVVLGLGAFGLCGLCACGDTGTTASRAPSATHPTTSPAVTPVTPTKSSAAANGEEPGAMFRADLERTGVYPSGGPTRRPELLWTFKTTSVAGMEFVSSPVVAEGVAFVGSQDCRLYAVDVRTGREMWTFKADDWVRSPAVSRGVVYVGSHDGSLYALDARSGGEKWEFRTRAAITSTPAVSRGVVYVGSEDGALYALNVRDGKEMWHLRSDAEISSSPAVSDGVVYVGSHDHYVYALDARTGRQRWKFEASGPVTTEAAVRDGVVYFGSWDNLGAPGAFDVVRPRSWDNLGSQATGDPSGHRLYAVDVRSGRQRWEFDAHGVVTSPAVAGGTAYVGSDDGYLYAVDVRYGLEKWKFWAGRGYFGVRSSPVLSGAVVYFGSGAPHRALHALDASSGQELWAFPVAGEIDDSPTISDGVVYFAYVSDASESLHCGCLTAVK
jgi:outer membrane protein assembly factor BamB